MYRKSPVVFDGTRIDGYRVQRCGRRGECLDKAAIRVHIASWQMFRSITTLFFILAIATQAMAGVCNCFESKQAPRHSCCKKSKSAGASVAAKSCCDAEACSFTNESSPQNRSESTTGNLLLKQQVLANVGIAWPVFAPPVADSHAAEIVFEKPPNLCARPPDLYLLYHSFLI